MRRYNRYRVSYFQDLLAQARNRRSSRRIDAFRNKAPPVIMRSARGHPHALTIEVLHMNVFLDDTFGLDVLMSPAN